MEHADYTLWMSMALDGMLAPEEERELHRHLSVCPECHALWETWMRMDEGLRTAPMATPSPGFPARVEARLRAHELRRRGAIGGLLMLLGSIALWSVLLLAVAAVVVWWLLGNPPALVWLMRLLITTISTFSVLLQVVRLIWESLTDPSVQPFMVGYASIMLGLAILWLHMVHRVQPEADRSAA